MKFYFLYTNYFLLNLVLSIVLNLDEKNQYYYNAKFHHIQLNIYYLQRNQNEDFH